ncbi:MAG TPA: hypothetical protein PL033_21225 [Candidatus Brocadiia bacterium]|nr:hypothetical protein [Candidatus Brocadiia bacterium]
MMQHFFSGALCNTVSCLALLADEHTDENDMMADDLWKPKAAQIEKEALEASRRIHQDCKCPARIPRPVPEFRAGVAELDITPSKPHYLDGYYTDRLSTGVHDPLMVKALVLDDGRTRIALVVMDAIAYFYDWVVEARKLQSAVLPENIVICTTHSHSAPCLLGVFGPPGKSVDPEYVRWIGQQTAKAIEQAAANLKPARLGSSEARLPVENGEITGVGRNWHNPGVVDPTILVIRIVESGSNHPIATIINHGNHPDVLGDRTTVTSADYFGYIYPQMTSAMGGTTLIFNRALGGVEPIGQGENNLAKAEAHMKRIADIVSANAIQAAQSVQWVESPRISIRKTRCEFPMLSKEMQEVSGRGISPVKPKQGVEITEMSLIEIGPAQMLTVPGEAHPEVAFKLCDMMSARYRFILSMADDEIGYIVPAELYNPEGIQELLSTGQDNEFVVLSAASRLLGVNGYVEPECLVGKKSRLPQ